MRNLKRFLYKFSLKLRRYFRRCLVSRVESFITPKSISRKSLYEDIMPYKNEVNIEPRVDEIVQAYLKYTKQKHVVIIDDSYGIVDVVKEYVHKIIDVNDDVNLNQIDILPFGGMHAPFILIEALKKLDLKHIDYAVIDIVLPGKMTVGGINTKYDGIDVAIHLNEFYGCNNFVFYSGNVVSEYVEYIGEKMSKFEAHFDRSLKDFIIYKGDLNESQTIEEFTKLFKKEKYCIGAACKDKSGF